MDPGIKGTNGLNFVRWSAARRTLPGREVDEEFESRADELHLFAFTTDHMRVGRHAGPCSVKLVTHGREKYEIGRRSVALHPGQILVLNAGQEYGSSIDEEGTSSISFFLPPEAVRSAFGPLTDPERMTRGSGATGEPPEVFQVPLRTDGGLARTVDRLTALVTRPRPGIRDRLEEAVLDVAEQALRRARGLAPPEVLADVVSRATREELIQRAVTARDLIHDLHGRVSLSVTAHHAGLSPYHFLRVFRDVFGRTPGAYARAVRLDRGRRLLARGESTAIAARHAGYASASAFRRALRGRDA